MTKYLVQNATVFTDWATRGEYESLEVAQMSARSFARHGACVRVITNDGTFVEGRTDEWYEANRAAYFAERPEDPRRFAVEQQRAAARGK